MIDKSARLYAQERGKNACLQNIPLEDALRQFRAELLRKRYPILKRIDLAVAFNDAYNEQARRTYDTAPDGD